MPDLIKRLPNTRASRAVKILSGKWKPHILVHLLQRPMRLSDLQRLIPNVSQKVLIQQLRELAEHGLVERLALPEDSGRLVYSLTELGLSLRPVLDSLCAWGTKHATASGALRQLQPCPNASVAYSVELEDRRVPAAPNGYGRTREPAMLAMPHRLEEGER